MTSLERFLAYANQLTGSIPTEVGKLTSLVDLSLEECAFFGAIPSELGHLRDLEQLWLYDNDLSSSIPSELGLLKAAKIIALDVNQLTGTVPVEIGQLATSLNEINITMNNLSGQVPDDLCDLERLYFACSDTLCGCQCTCRSA
jgi:Leucine-rich repeat (LRR) protein